MTIELAATKGRPEDHAYDVWWYSEPGLDEQMVYWLRSLGVISKLPNSTPLRIGWRLFSKRKMSEVMKVLRRRTHGDVHRGDLSVREVPQTIEREAGDRYRR